MTRPATMSPYPAASTYVAENVSFSAGGRQLLDDVSLELRPGAVTVLVGPNGAGKSTLLKLIAGELKPSSGHVRLDGEDIFRLSPRALARRRAVLPQSVEVAFPFTAAEVIGVGLMGERSLEHQRAARLLAQVDLKGFADRPYDRLSGGERQRVQLARVLGQLESGGAGDPTFLLLDEPTASLDLAHQLLVLRHARAHAEKGGGVLMVLHDLNLAAMTADHVMVLASGRTAAAGPPAEVITDAVLSQAFGVKVRVGHVPEGPFVLPQGIQEGA